MSDPIPQPERTVAERIAYCADTIEGFHYPDATVLWSWLLPQMRQWVQELEATQPKKEELMQGTYEITEVQQGRTYENRKGGGNLTVYRVALKDARSEAPDGLFELHKKEGNEPKPGPIEVDKSWSGEHNGETWVRIKEVYGGGDKSYNTMGGDSKNFDRRPEHPRNEARMIHTSAMSAAPGYIEQMLTIGVVQQPQDENAYWSLVARVATVLRGSYANNMPAAEAAPTPPPSAPSDAPPDQQGLQPAGGPRAGQGAVKVDDDIPF